MASRPVSRISGPWVKAAVRYSRSAKTLAVRLVCETDVQKADNGQVIRAFMLKMESPVLSVSDPGWNKLM